MNSGNHVVDFQEFMDRKSYKKRKRIVDEDLDEVYTEDDE